jgi:hypothetical protein
VGTAFPALTTEEASFPTAWVKVGAQVDKSYSEAGVTVTNSQSISTFTPAGSTVVRKAWRTEEGFQVAFEIADLSPETYALVMDNATVTHVTGTPGSKTFQMKRGFTAHQQALLLRGPSPAYEGKFSQFNVYACYQGANPAPKLAAKGGPAMLAVQYIATEAENNKFVEFTVQTTS